MKLFHGSLVRVEYPDVTIGRDSLDFGRGFYMTRDYEQAVRWTNILVKREPSGVRTIHLNCQMMRLKNITIACLSLTTTNGLILLSLTDLVERSGEIMISLKAALPTTRSLTP